MDICDFPFKQVHAAIIVEGSGSSLIFLFEVVILVRAFLFRASNKLIIIISLFTLQTVTSISDIYFRNLNYKQCVEQLNADQIWPTVKVSQSMATISNLCFCLAYFIFASNYWSTSVHTPQKIKRDEIRPPKRQIFRI